MPGRDDTSAASLKIVFDASQSNTSQQAAELTSLNQQLDNLKQAESKKARRTQLSTATVAHPLKPATFAVASKQLEAMQLSLKIVLGTTRFFNYFPGDLNPPARAFDALGFTRTGRMPFLNNLQQEPYASLSLSSCSAVCTVSPTSEGPVTAHAHLTGVGVRGLLCRPSWGRQPFCIPFQ